MILGGFQKLSLIDYPQKVSSVVFTQGCLFRCPFCHNPELIPLKSAGAVEVKEVLNYLESKKGMLEGLCITGGEPTMQKDLPEFIAAVKKIGLAVKLDTNGTNPAMVEQLIKDNLVDYFAMDLKHTWSKYDLVANIGNQNAIDNCQKTFKLIQDSKIDHEFRTTVFPAVHREDDFIEIVKNIKPGEKYFLQQVEYIKNLDPQIDKTKILDLESIIAKLKMTFPAVIINGR
ncbi:MAG: anaerobic ribonucleoside-triphosphate reductase activating protein [Candidatus Buchananbacteria bacterium]|nr:anaerobic ribonucleoside-triphosphate reductase activating protein [Candidatus Buchananbacteria bacterium]